MAGVGGLGPQHRLPLRPGEGMKLCPGVVHLMDIKMPERNLHFTQGIILGEGVLVKDLNNKLCFGVAGIA